VHGEPLTTCCCCSGEQSCISSASDSDKGFVDHRVVHVGIVAVARVRIHTVMVDYTFVGNALAKFSLECVDT
jgi:hypothetical protein